MAQAGDSSLWVSWDQPSVLRRARSPTACEGSCCPEARNLPSREWMFACGDPRRSQCRHHNGLYAARGINDGNPFGVRRSRHPDVFAAPGSHRTRPRRDIECQVWIAGNSISRRGLDEILNAKSGLLGISGLSADMRMVVSAMQEGNARAKLAFEVFIHRLRSGIAAMAATLSGMDALVFTAGIGENSAEVRSEEHTSE